MNKPKVVVFSGAGLSQESGIPTFRASNGLWHEHRVEDVASPEGWERDKELVLNFYKERWKNIKYCKPNAAHLAFAKLEEKYDVHHITQNIDDLLERAGCTNIFHLHGSINDRKCEKHHNIFGHRYGYRCDEHIKNQEVPVELGDLCSKCGGQMRPDVVWFGESVDMKNSYMIKLVAETDVFIGVGTSAQVYPAADMIRIFKCCSKKYFIDPKATSHMLFGFKAIDGKAGEAVPNLVEQLLKEVENEIV